MECCPNGPFPSCCLSRFRSESWCSTIVREMSWIFIRIRNSFPFEWLCTRTRFETEPYSNSEMGYSIGPNSPSPKHSLEFLFFGFLSRSYALDPAVEAVKASCNLSEREIPSVVVASGPQNRVTQEDVTRKVMRDA